MYDDYANPTLTQNVIFSGSSNQVVETKVVYTAYGAFGSTFPDKPTNIETVLMRDSEPTYSSIATLTYNTKGQVETQKEFFGQPKELSTVNEYHLHGGIKKVTVSSSGLVPQIKHTEFDPKGRYITEIETL